MRSAFPIRTEEDLARAARLVQELWNAEPGTPGSDLLEVMADLIELYDREHSQLEPGDPIEVMRFKLEDLGWSQNRLAKEAGCSSGRVSEVMTRKRPLTLKMVQDFSKALGLPAGLLVHDARSMEGGGRWVRLDEATARQANELADRAGLGVEELLSRAVRACGSGAQMASAVTVTLSTRPGAGQPSAGSFEPLFTATAPVEAA